MAITTLDGAAAGAQPGRYFAKGVTAALVAGRPASLWPLAGMPGPGAYDTTLNGVILSSTSALVNGQIPHVDPVSGLSYLLRLQAQATQPGTLLLCDRLWSNGGITATLTTAQAIVSPTFPARDNAASTNGDGVLLGLEVSAATGAGTQTLTVSAATSSATAGTVALAQSHALTLAAATSSGTAGTVSLGQTHSLAASSATSATTAATVTLSGGAGLAVANAASAATAGTVALTQAHSLTVSGATSAGAAALVALGQSHGLAVAGALSASLASTVALDVSGGLVVSSAVSAGSASTVALAQTHVLGADVAISSTFAQTVTLPGGVSLAAGHGRQDTQKRRVGIEVNGRIRLFESEEYAAQWLAAREEKAPLIAEMVARRAIAAASEPVAVINALQAVAYRPAVIVQGTSTAGRLLERAEATAKARFDAVVAGYVAKAQADAALIAQQLADEDDDEALLLLML